VVASAVDSSSDYVQSGRRSHWLTFDIKGDYGYVAPNKNSSDETEIFNTPSHTAVGLIGYTEDMIEMTL
jgi:hypothetical protein